MHLGLAAGGKEFNKRCHFPFLLAPSKESHNAIWLCYSSALLPHSTDAEKPGHPLRFPGPVYSSLHEGMGVHASDPIGNDIL